jgi:hypothetical protein
MTFSDHTTAALDRIVQLLAPVGVDPEKRGERDERGGPSQPGADEPAVPVV